jgi:hypothetical protein
MDICRGRSDRVRISSACIGFSFFARLRKYGHRPPFASNRAWDEATGDAFLLTEGMSSDIARYRVNPPGFDLVLLMVPRSRRTSVLHDYQSKDAEECCTN